MTEPGRNQRADGIAGADGGADGDDGRGGMPRRGRIARHRYLVAVVDGGGNVPPELGVVRRLLARGHDVTVLAEDSVAAEVGATGAEPLRWRHAPNRRDRRPENDPCRDWECRYPWQLVDRLVKTVLVGPAAGYAHDVGDVITETRPSAVLCSMFCVGGMIAAEAAGIPFVVVLPNIYPLPAEGMPAFGIGLAPARGRLGRWRDRVVNALIEHQWDAKGLSGLNELRRQYGLSPLPHLLDQVRSANRQLVLTAREFDFAAALPPGARYVGPVLDDPAWAETETPWTPPLAPLSSDAPLVLVAMSSTFQDQRGCLQRVIEALAKLTVRAVVTTGPAIDPADLNPPENVTVVRSAPHRQVLEHTALVITHGGHGTVMKALAAGVPLLLMPHGRDQPDTAARVVTRGAGITLKRTARPAAIASAASRVLEMGSYRAAAQRLGEVVRREAGSDALVRELEEIPDYGASGLMPPMSSSMRYIT
jgi:MGT family glycosyltransferase